jgi:proline dehydrogenase
LKKNNLEFNNTKIAFNYKSNFDLKRAYFLFKLLSLGYISRFGRKLLKTLVWMNFPIDSLIKKTVYAQFCGGTDILDCVEVINNLKKSNVYSILDYSIEGSVNENDFENSFNKCLKILEECKSKNLSKFIVFKPSAVGRFELYKKITSNTVLSDIESKEWSKVEIRFNKICLEASKKDIMVLVDAEESWIQTAIDELVTKMMNIYNSEKAVVFNTIQAYRKDRFDYLTKLYNDLNGSVKIGVKLVRGAYMEKERKRAKKYNYISPICENKEQTDEVFNNSLRFIIKNINDFGLFVGSHNEKSNILATELLKKYKIDSNDQRIWFSQLYGMSDNISFTLANSGYNVAKYLPFGPVNEVMPYLMRRLDENSSISSQTNRELQLIKKELKRRKN